MLNRRSFARLLTAIAAASVLPGIAWAQNTPVAKNVVLVHGLYADGSSWIDVIPYLQRAGLQVTAVQNPLTSLTDDVAATRRVLALQDGPTVLVGHSFAGTIISEAGNDPKVSALGRGSRARCGRGLRRTRREISETTGERRSDQAGRIFLAKRGS